MVFAVLLDENDVCVEHRVGLVTSSARGRGALWLWWLWLAAAVALAVPPLGRWAVDAASPLVA